MNHWAMHVAMPDPAIPHPNPMTNRMSRAVLSAAPHAAATRVMRTF